MNLLDNMTSDLDEIVGIILNAKENAYRKVNEELIKMYWNIGKKLSEKSQEAEYGDKYIDKVAKLIHNKHPELKGFNRRSLYRMKQFYDVYCDDQFVSPLVTQLSWTNNLIILSSTKTKEEREFYLRLAIKERYSKRELERQIQSSYYERAVLSKSPLLPESIKRLPQSPFLDSYIIEFLDLPEKFDENSFRKSLISQMKKFVLIKKEYENPSVGLILCANKDNEIVEYSLSRTLSPLMVSEYQLKLPSKEILQKKLQEIVEMSSLSEKNSYDEE